MLEQSMKKKWVDALRSKKYPQGAGYLCKDDKYCCLGVLLEINNFLTDRMNDDGVRYDSEYGSCSLLSIERRASFGLTNKEINELVYMNDRSPRPIDFNKIADWIEKNL